MQSSVIYISAMGSIGIYSCEFKDRHEISKRCSPQTLLNLRPGDFHVHIVTCIKDVIPTLASYMKDNASLQYMSNQVLIFMILAT